MLNPTGFSEFLNILSLIFFWIFLIQLGGYCPKQKLKFR